MNNKTNTQNRKRLQGLFFVFIICLISLTTSKSLVAQTRLPAIPDSLKDWHFHFVGALNGNQAAYSNWSQGGVNALAVTGATNFQALYRENRFGYQLDVNLKYGQARLQGKGVRKTDDMIKIDNQIDLYMENPVISAFTLVSFQSQFDKGFKYNDNAPDEFLSSFLSPAYVQEVAGYSYQPVDFFKAKLGFSFKQTIIKDTVLSTRYGLKPNHYLKSESGAYFGLQFQKTILPNVTLSSGFDSFTSFLKPVSSTDFTWNNELIGQINKFMSANLQFSLVYNDDVTKALQVKQVLGLGVNITIL